MAKRKGAGRRLVPEERVALIMGPANAALDINVELFNCNRVYRCIVLRRLLPEVQRDLRYYRTRDLLRMLWAEGGEARIASEAEVRWRLFGNRQVAA